MANLQIDTRVIGPITKAETPTHIESDHSTLTTDFIPHPTALIGYKTLVSESAILPQCIRAYKNNIAGFGIGVRYKGDVAEPTAEMETEWAQMEELLAFLNLDQNVKELFADVIEAREIYGIAFIEVIRNTLGEVVGVEHIKLTHTVTKTAALEPFVDVEYTVRGTTLTRPKRFCKYQQQHNGETVFFKEIGDHRKMDKRTGEYLEEEDKVIPVQYQANEILEFAIGVEPYGEVRWSGQILGVDGSRSAEALNRRYFSEGRHNPMMIMVEGGTLSDTSFEKLTAYVNGIKGPEGQHAFILLETTEVAGKTVLDGERPPSIKIENLAPMLQKDELFQDYLNNHRRKVQSAFQLPDIYVGYTTDFNRATAVAAQEVTEQQVFQPERANLAWAINNKLFAEYNFQHVEAYFLEPDVSNIDDITKLMNVAVKAGGVTPNKAKEVAYKALGGQAEDFDADWATVPIAVQSLPGFGESGEELDKQIQQQVAKAVEHGDSDIAAVLKEIRALLLETAEAGESAFTNTGKSDTVNEGEGSL